MAIHYNAFISYRHHPDDIKVASDIHRSLERFHVPKDLRKQGKTITRLFRDKDELPITSSLTTDIYEALENSDYLIVICSVHTKESIWVQREIETFLKTHSRNKVLTVLASGEPYDVIPDILLREQVADPDTGELEWREIEPLSCDWRLKRKQAVREELPRLAAALLGCTYDQLRQRQRQYRMRRMIAFFSMALAASLSLAAYFLHTSIQIQKANDALHEANIQIQNNLDRALCNQSDYLASVSQERMDAGDRLTALALALEALPNENNNRPYVANAEYALSNALASYRSTTEIRAVGAFDAGSLVKDFRVTDDGKYIYILDSRNIITMWDTNSFQQISAIDLGAYRPDNLSVTPEGSILFLSGTTDSLLLCYDQNGNLKWEIPNCRDIAYYDDGNTLLVLCNGYSTPYQLHYIDPKTGENLNSPTIISRSEFPDSYFDFSQDSYAADTAVTLYANTFYEDILCHLDLETGELQEIIRIESGIAAGAMNIDSVSALDHDRILFMVSDGSGSMNGRYNTFHYYSASKAQVICFSISTGNELWENEIVTHVYSAIKTMEQIPETNTILCQRGNTFCVLDMDTGANLATCVVPSVPVSLNLDTRKAWGILENGQYYEYKYDENNCITMPVMEGSVTDADVNNGAFILTPLTTHIRVYRSIKDNRGEQLADSEDISVSTTLQHGKYLVLKDSAGIYLFDTEENRRIRQWDTHYSDKLLQFAEDSTGFWIWDSQEVCIQFLEIDTGETTVIQISDQLEEEYSWISSPVFCSDGKVTYSLTADSRRAILQTDFVTGQTQIWDLKPVDFPEYGESIYILASDENEIIYWEKHGCISRLLTDDGSIQRIMDEVETCPVSAWNEQHTRIAMTLGHDVVLMNNDGTDPVRFSLETRKGVSMYFRSEDLLILCDDGTMWRYDLQGNPLSQTTLMIFNTFTSSVRSAGTVTLDIFWTEMPDGSLLINALGAGNLLDTQQWQRRAYLPNLKTYLPKTNQILCSGNEGYYFYRPYSTQEQILYAKQILGTFELSEKEKEYYGLD